MSAVAPAAVGLPMPDRIGLLRHRLIGAWSARRRFMVAAICWLAIVVGERSVALTLSQNGIDHLLEVHSATDGLEQGASALQQASTLAMILEGPVAETLRVSDVGRSDPEFRKGLAMTSVSAVEDIRGGIGAARAALLHTHREAHSVEHRRAHSRDDHRVAHDHGHVGTGHAEAHGPSDAREDLAADLDHYLEALDLAVRTFVQEGLVRSELVAPVLAATEPDGLRDQLLAFAQAEASHHDEEIARVGQGQRTSMIVGLSLALLFGVTILRPNGMRMVQLMARKVEQAERRQQEMRDVARVTAHHVREPLRKVSVFADRVQGSIDDEACATDVGRLRRATLLAAERLDHVMMFADLRDDSLTHEIVAFDEIVEEAVAELGPAAGHLETRLGRLPVVVGDRQQLVLLVANLLKNSVQNESPDRPIEVVMTSSQSRRRAGRRVVVRIRDNGRGIPAEHVGRVTELFYRVEPDDDRAGAGLAVCRRIAEGHGWDFTLESEEGVGTTVELTLRALRPGQMEWIEL